MSYDTARDVVIGVDKVVCGNLSRNRKAALLARIGSLASHIPAARAYALFMSGLVAQDVRPRGEDKTRFAAAVNELVKLRHAALDNDL